MLKEVLAPFFSPELAIDLGTDNTLVFMKGRGIVLDEPSVLAVRRATGEVLAVGREAKEMLGRTPRGVQAVKPLQGGVVSSLWATERMLGHFVKKVRSGWSLGSGRTVIGVPGDSTPVERKAVQQAAHAARLSNVDLVEEVLAAAIGADLPIDEPFGRMVIDMGAGTTDIAVLSLSGIVASSALRVGGNDLDEAIVQYVKRRHRLLIGEPTAERIKIAVGSACEVPGPDSVVVTGRGLATGLPHKVTITADEVRDAIAKPVSDVVSAVLGALEKTPPELSADIYDRGLVLTGGGSLLRGMAERLAEETGLHVSRVNDPLSSVALGTGRML